MKYLSLILLSFTFTACATTQAQIIEEHYKPTKGGKVEVSISRADQQLEQEARKFCDGDYEVLSAELGESDGMKMVGSGSYAVMKKRKPKTKIITFECK